MRRTVKVLFACALLFMGTTSSLGANADSIVTELQNFLSVPPRARLDTSLAAKDFRFLGVYGYTVEVPGVPSSESSRITRSGVFGIPGTSDALLSEEHAQLTKRARSYAEQYNRLLLRYFSQVGP